MFLRRVLLHDMLPLPTLEIVLFGINLSLAVYVIMAGPTVRTYRILSLYLCTMALQMLIFHGYAVSRSYSEACLWRRVDIIWPFYLGLPVYFAISFSEILSSKTRFYFLVMQALPALFFFFIELSTELLTGPPVKKPWGWTLSFLVSQGGSFQTFLSVLFYIWMPYSAIFSLYLILRRYLVPQSTRKKKESLLVFLGLIISLSSGFVNPTLTSTGAISPDVWIQPYTDLGMTVGHFLMVAGMLKYGDNRYSKPFASTTIPMIVVNNKNVVSYCSKSACELLGYTPNALTGAALEMIMRTPVPLDESTGEQSPIEIQPFDSDLKTQSGRNLPFNINGLRYSAKGTGEIILFLNKKSA